MQCTFKASHGPNHLGPVSCWQENCGVGSCCTLVAEQYFEHAPDLLAAEVRSHGLQLQSPWKSLLQLLAKRSSTSRPLGRCCSAPS